MQDDFVIASRWGPSGVTVTLTVAVARPLSVSRGAPWLS